MSHILVKLPCGAGLVQRSDGRLMVIDDVKVGDGVGALLRPDDKFAPEQHWVDADQSVVAGLLPPDAVSAEVVDDRGHSVLSTVNGEATPPS